MKKKNIKITNKQTSFTVWKQNNIEREIYDSNNVIII